MAGSKLPGARKPGSGRLFWIIGLAVGIIAGGAVAIGVTSSIDRVSVGSN